MRSFRTVTLKKKSNKNQEVGTYLTVQKCMFNADLENNNKEAHEEKND